MTAQTAIPLKWYVPFAQNDSSRVEIPVTTTDATRASQSLGFPPLTMQPPESGGVPPQGEDFNGGMNQVARVCWWVLNGGGWPFDATFATNSNINGYPNGAKLQTADFAGDWLNTIDNNQNNPDTTGTNWVPGYVYGAYALTGQTGGTTTLAPSVAKFKNITIAGVLTSALTVVLPAWTYDWTITNNTTGAFVVIVKTAAGSGVTIPQNNSPTRVTGDGTNITQPAANIAAATSSTQPAQFGQMSPLFRNFISGLYIANNGTNPTTQIDFAAGTAADSANAYLMTLSAVMTKTLQSTGAWAVGSGNNGLFTGARANSTWYHCFVIRNSASGAIDAGFDTSVSAANIPVGWTAYRRVGSILTDGSGNIRAFIQVGNEILWSVPVRDINATGVASGSVLYAVTVPPAVIVEAIIQGIASSTGGSCAVHINAPGYSDVSSYACPTIITPGVSQAGSAGRVYIRTNTLQQIQLNSNLAGNTFSFAAYGWRDYRGTNA